MIKSIYFSLIDAKEGDVVEINGFPKTEKNVRLLNELTTKYLKGIKKLQTELEIEYFSQFEQVGEEVSDEKFYELDDEFWKNRDDTLLDLYYT